MNGIALVRKPSGMTSFAVVAQVKRQLGINKIGHAGTLDPQAEGLMILLLGKATKALPYLHLEPKRYQASLRLGLHTDTGDVWGKVLKQVDPINVPLTTIQNVLDGFKGTYAQIPPMVSALSFKGKRLYSYHREGRTVERESRTVRIYDIQWRNNTPDGFDFEVSVSSGTYIRTLCEDIAQRLNTIGTMSRLLRIAVGGFTLETAQTLDELTPKQIRIYAIEPYLNLPMVSVQDETWVKQGKSLQLTSVEPQVIVSVHGQALAVYERIDESPKYKCQRGLW